MVGGAVTVEDFKQMRRRLEMEKLEMLTVNISFQILYLPYHFDRRCQFAALLMSPRTYVCMSRVTGQS
jgi:hypothetical protein